MASNYPGSLDSLSNPSGSTQMGEAGYYHDEQHANANDAIEAIQGELGTDPAGGAATVKARLDTGFRRFLVWASGEYLMPQVSGASAAGTVSLSANTMYYLPLFIPTSFTADRVGFRVSTGQASANIRLGLYADSSGLPSGAAVTDFGEVDASSSGWKELTISQSLTGDSWVWLGLLNETASVAVNASSQVTIIKHAFDTSGPIGSTYLAQSSATYSNGLPTVGSLNHNYGSGCPLIGFRRS